MLDEEGRVVDAPGADVVAAGSLRAAVAVERQWRASRREATRGAPGWAIEAARRDEQTVRLLRQVRDAAVRAQREAEATATGAKS